MNKLKVKTAMLLTVLLATMVQVAPVAVVGVVSTGCATNKVAEGSEVFVVRAEQTYKNLDKTFRAFTTFEYNNRAVLQKLSPKFEQAANTVRIDGFNALEALQKSVVEYKANRTPENRDKIGALMDRVALIENVITEYQNTAKLTQ